MNIRIVNLYSLFFLFTCVCIIKSDEKVESGEKSSLHKDTVASGAKKLFGLKSKESDVHFNSEVGSKAELKKVVKRDSTSEGTSDSNPEDHDASANAAGKTSSSSENPVENDNKENSEVGENLKEGSETSENDENDGENEKVGAGKTDEGEKGKPDEGEKGKTDEEENGKTDEGKNGKPDEEENETDEDENTHNKENGIPENREEENTVESVKETPPEPEILESTPPIEKTSKATTVSEEHSTPTPHTTSGKSTEVVPVNTFSVRSDSDGEICVLVKFQAYIVSEDETIINGLPESAHANGKCGDKRRFIKISWNNDTFTMNFSKVHNGKQCFWTVIGMHLLRGTASYYYTRDETKGDPFKVECKMSYYCSESDIRLYKKDDDDDDDTDDEIIVRLKQMALQPFSVKSGKFSEDVYKCRENMMEKVRQEHAAVPVQDETVPLAVGLTLAILTLIAVLGFSIHRAYVMRKVDYNSME